MPGQPAKLLRIHFSGGARYKGRPLHEAIVNRCMELDIAGATVFKGVEGFGESSDLQRAPVAIHIVDTEENIARLLPAIEEMLDTGMIAISSVSAIRVLSRSRPER